MFCDVRSMGTPIDAKSLLGLASNGWFTQQSMEFHVMCYLMLYDMVQIYLMYTLPQRWASRTMGLESSFLIRTSQFFFPGETRAIDKQTCCSVLFEHVRLSIQVYQVAKQYYLVIFCLSNLSNIDVDVPCSVSGFGAFFWAARFSKRFPLSIRQRWGWRRRRMKPTPHVSLYSNPKKDRNS
jgi:hypothetical protein